MTHGAPICPRSAHPRDGTILLLASACAVGPILLKSQGTFFFSALLLLGVSVR